LVIFIMAASTGNISPRPGIASTHPRWSCAMLGDVFWGSLNSEAGDALLKAKHGDDD
jgi:hypothetical protein